MSAMVAKAAVVTAAAGGLAASSLLPLRPQAPVAPVEALRMPVATKELTVSVFPAPGRPESSTGPLERPEPPAARPPSSPAPRTPSGRVPSRPTGRTPAPALLRPTLPPIRPQTDERLLAELGPARPDDRSRRPLVAE